MAVAAPKLVVMLLVLLAGPLMAGCSHPEGPPAALSCEEEHEVPEDSTWLRVLIARPLYSNELGLVRLVVKPTAIGMVRNETGVEPYATELPGERIDWTQDQSLWFEGGVPSGKYNFLRISLDEDIQALRTDGAEPEVRVRFGRLTITHPNPEAKIELEGGTCFTLLHEPVMTIIAKDTYEIADKAE